MSNLGHGGGVQQFMSPIVVRVYMRICVYIVGLVQDCSISNALAMENGDTVVLH